jgi:beta-glucuronidase
MTRPDWMCLNGEWQFETDPGDSGFERGLLHKELGRSILVPFAPESIASGIGDVDFLHAVWYRRVVTIPDEWQGRDVLLHFGAVDHDATVWANGVEVARHRGGFSSFTADLSGVVSGGDVVTIVVRARDTPSEPQARGKQSTWYDNTGCNYTRTTGIWQSVWLEPVPRTRIRNLRITPSVASSGFSVTSALVGNLRSTRLAVTLRDGNGEIVVARIAAGLDLSPTVHLSIPTDRVRLWDPADPFLYDVIVELLDGDDVIDRVESYAGLRSVAIDGHRILLNGRPLFQRLVLDQGYWPDTLMTAPSDEALLHDIELSMNAGFNGARLHQKVFEERFYYHADRLGYLVWAEFGDWGVSGQGAVGHNQQPTASFITQWLEVLERDHSHPSIIGWCPLNETHQSLHDTITVLDDVTHGMYLATKLADPSRPVIDASGYSHRVRGADVYDSHSYEQDPTLFAQEQSGLRDGRPHTNTEYERSISIPYAGQPYFVSEYGGIWWNADLAGDPREQDADRAESWGYGQRVSSSEEWFARFAGLTDVLLDEPLMFGYCYTQLTDTFQEENGLYTFDRVPKFDIERVSKIQSRTAAYERGQS